MWENLPYSDRPRFLIPYERAVQILKEEIRAHVGVNAIETPLEENFQGRKAYISHGWDEKGRPLVGFEIAEVWYPYPDYYGYIQYGSYVALLTSFSKDRHEKGLYAALDDFASRAEAERSGNLSSCAAYQNLLLSQ